MENELGAGGGGSSVPHDDWLPTVPADIDVEPDNLESFAGMVQGDRELFREDLTAATQAAFDQEIPFPSFSGAALEGRGIGMPEGYRFGIDYWRAWNAMQFFLVEMQQGQQILEQGARNIHMAYAGQDALGGATVAGSFERYQDVMVVRQAFGTPGPAPRQPEDEGEFDLSALEDEAAAEFEDRLEQQEDLQEMQDDVISGDDDSAPSWESGDIDPRDPEVVLEGEPGELSLPQDNEGMDAHQPGEHPAPNLEALD